MLNWERAGAILSLFIPAVWQEHAKSSSPFPQILWDDCERNAIVRAWTHEVSYVQGPPGTGKSHTITAIMLSALFLKKSVLLVSHKKPAIDVVFDKLTKDT